MQNMVFRIDSTGTIHGLYHDMLTEINTGNSRRVRRISEVEFDEDTQKWCVLLLLNDGHHQLGDGFATRKEALAAEVEYFNQAIEEGSLDISREV